MTGCNAIRRIVLTQSAGTGVHADSISVCRKPVLAVGDSFVNTGSGVPVALNNVGKFLGAAFSQTRYVIPCGLSGAPLSTISDRWNGTGQGCAFRDVVVTFVNGPGLNDFASVTMTASDLISYKTIMFGKLAKMIGEAVDDSDALGGSNDVVSCEMINYYDNGTYSTTAKTAMIQQYNSLISFLSYSDQIPMAKTFSGFNPATMLQGTGPHPNDAVGNPWIASQIAQAYENNEVPISFLGDLNGDFKVDFEDFALFAEHWLEETVKY